MTPVLWTYGLYLILSLALTLWVGRTLHRNGRVFLVEAFGGNATLADSVNHLLVVGFYLVNAGYITRTLQEPGKPSDAAASLEMLSAKIGLVLLVLGGMHFLNLFVFARMRQHWRSHEAPAAVR